MSLIYKEIPQKQYLINGIPAYKYGEWPGIKSSHWNGSIRIIQPVENGKIFDDGVLQIEKNRKHFQQKYGIEQTQKNAKRLFSAAIINYPEKKTGLKTINFRPSSIRTITGKKQFPQKFGFEKIPNNQGIRTFYPNGLCETFKENTIEKQMGGKRRIWTTEQQRNGMAMRSPGDKFYRTSEQFPTYYKEGGLIPGSTIATNYNKTQSKQAYNFYETLDLTKPILDREKIYENKMKKETLDYDKNYVENIIGKWEKNILNDFDPNYLKKKPEVPEVETFKRPMRQLPKLNKNAKNAKGKGKK